jgi:hypothetical protein
LTDGRRAPSPPAAFSRNGDSRCCVSLVLFLLLTVLAACGGSHEQTSPLTVRLVQGDSGPRSYTLGCSPPSGTASDPERICAAIEHEPGLLTSHPGADHSCPYGPPAVVLAGTWSGHPIHARFSVCTSGQEQAVATWIQLLHYGPVHVLHASRPRAGQPKLILRQHAPGLTRAYPSGAVWHLRITDSKTGRTAFAANIYYGFRGSEPVSLPPGTYRVESAELVCHGNCSQLSAPVDSCARTVSLANQALPLVIDEHAHHPCQIKTT